jgi:hypothetical protein
VVDQAELIQQLAGTRTGALRTYPVVVDTVDDLLLCPRVAASHNAEVVSGG